MSYLPANIYVKPQPAWRQFDSNTNGLRRHQRSISRAHTPQPVKVPSHSRQESTALEEDFPTPKANGLAALTTPAFAESCVTPFVNNTARRDSVSSCSTDFDDCDSSSDADTEVVPLKVSDSIRRHIPKPDKKQGRPPSLKIPPPSAWPMVHKMQQQGKPGTRAIAPCPKTPLSPDNLKQVPGFLAIPAKSATPSLTGSLTSDEATSISCPSTPSLRGRDEEHEQWDEPLQLNQEAMETLRQISSEFDFDQMDAVIEVPEEEAGEMRERGRSLNLTIPMSQEDSQQDEEDIISAISIPSPGGFFASLDSGSQFVWNLPSDSPNMGPTTSAAENFYNLPWANDSDSVVNQVVHSIRNSEDEQGPPTARRLTSMDKDIVVDEIETISQEVEYDEEYEDKLHKTATENMSRTSMWLSAQSSYLSALTVRNPINESDSPLDEVVTPLSSSPESANDSSPSKKSVRFVDTQDKAEAKASSSPSAPKSDPTLYQAYQHLTNQHSSLEGVLQASIRAEALQTQRLYLPKAHRAELLHEYKVPAIKPIKEEANGAANADDEILKQRRTVISQANREKDALKQVTSSFWNVQGNRLFHGGELLPKQISSHINAMQIQGSTAKVLDLGGEPTASWGWAAAIEFRNAKVVTACVNSAKTASRDWEAFSGPSNHSVVSVSNPWTLPFPSDSFDVISARTLHTLLHTSPVMGSPTSSSDEYEATLNEIRRVLAPGGYLHFTLFDAELTAPKQSMLSGLSTEFVVALRTRGYDPNPGRHFFSRLLKAEFGDVKRSWVSLPLSAKQGNNAAAATGMLGAVEWERWMLKLQMEMGRPEARLLEGVAKALEETKMQVDCGFGVAGWNVLVGCAQKPLGDENWI